MEKVREYIRAVLQGGAWKPSLRMEKKHPKGGRGGRWRGSPFWNILKFGMALVRNWRRLFCLELLPGWEIAYAGGMPLGVRPDKGLCAFSIWGAGRERNLSEEEEIEERAGYLLDSYGNSILRLAYSYMHNMADAEDVLQETMLRYLGARPEFINENHEKRWLLRVAINLCKDRLSYNKLREADELDEALVAECNEDLSFVWEAVKRLPEKYREVIHLYYQEGYSNAQIADILEEKESTVRSNMRRGRQKLKEILREEFDFYE